MKGRKPLKSRTRLRRWAKNGKSTRARARLRKDLDKLWSLVIRKRDGKCLWPDCGKTASLQASHIYSRGAHPATRWDLANGFALCLRHHLYGWHRDPIYAMDLAKNIIGSSVFERSSLDELRIRANGSGKGRDLEALELELKAELAKLS